MINYIVENEKSNYKDEINNIILRMIKQKQNKFFVKIFKNYRF